METRPIVRRRIPRWRRTQYLTSLFGTAALLAAMGTGSVFAADPLPADGELTLDPQEQPVGRTALPIIVIDHIGDPIIIKPAIPKILPVEPPGQDPDADAPRSMSRIPWIPRVEDPAPADDPAADVEDPAPAEDPENTGDEPPDPADDATCAGESQDEVPDPIENPGEAPDADDVPDAAIRPIPRTPRRPTARLRPTPEPVPPMSRNRRTTRTTLRSPGSRIPTTWAIRPTPRTASRLPLTIPRLQPVRASRGRPMRTGWSEPPMPTRSRAVVGPTTSSARRVPTPSPATVART